MSKGISWFEQYVSLTPLSQGERAYAKTGVINTASACKLAGSEVLGEPGTRRTKWEARA